VGVRVVISSPGSLLVPGESGVGVETAVSTVSEGRNNKVTKMIAKKYSSVIFREVFWCSAALIPDIPLFNILNTEIYLL
jgi:hypothetical protein